MKEMKENKIQIICIHKPQVGEKSFCCNGYNCVKLTSNGIPC